MCCYYEYCPHCPLYNEPCDLVGTSLKDAEKIVAIVEQWAKEHPRMTNRQKFKEIFGIDAADTLLDTFHSTWLGKEYKEPEGKT